MSFAIWHQRPPFAEADLSLGELIYFRAADGSWQRFDPIGSKVQDGSLFCVTDQGVPAADKVNAVLNPLPAPKSLDNGQLAAVLVAQKIIPQSVLDAAIAADAVPTVSL